MKKILLLIIPVFLAASALKAQTEMTYPGTIAKENYVNNGSYGPFELGFTFTFFGQPQTQFFVTSNGLVTFGAGSTASANVTIPMAALPNNYIAPFWDDLTIEESGTIMYTTLGAAPNRMCIIQFRNMGFYPFPVFMGTFQVILYETSNKIQVQYRLVVDVTSDKNRGGSATIGIENSDGTAGFLYAFNEPEAISKGLAISFTPDPPTSSNYEIDNGALYAGFFLTKNIAMPEPGITTLVSPAQGAIIGDSITFEWAEASNASSYTLLLSNYSDLTDATVYNPGNNFEYKVTGLILDTTYYWGVFANNATSTTWCEIKKFETSATPPLAALQRTIWVEQGDERLIKLQYTGGDGSPVSATITSLPEQGALYQVTGGTTGVEITSVPAVVTDEEMQVIYLANGSTGMDTGSFNFFVTDDNDDSPVAKMTINVNPPGVPNVILTARNEGVEIQFDRIMNNPAGTEGQFTIMVDGSPVAATSAALKPGDPVTIVLTLATPLTGTEEVIISYTKGTVSATTGGVLETFTDEHAVLIAQTLTFPEIPVKTFGDPDYTPGASSSGITPVIYSSSNLQVATIVLNKIRFIGAGTATITAIQEGDETYAPARYERPLTVSKANQTITFGPLDPKTYNDPDFTISATSSSGLPVSFSNSNNSVATISGTTVDIHDAGATVITASQPGNENYNPAPDVPQTLTVNKITLTVTAGDATKQYLEPIPALPYTIAGFVNEETPAVIDMLPITVTTATQTSDAGTYPISFTGGSDNNYDFTFVNGTLTITQIDQTITFGVMPASVVMGTPLTLPATSTSGLTVSFESLSPAVATVSGNILTGIARGTANIRAYHAGNINYLQAEAFTSLDITTTHRDVLHLFTPNNDGINDLWEIPGKAELGKCDVKVYNRWGKPVYANGNYNNDWDGTSEGKPVPEGAYVFIIISENGGRITGTVNIVR